MELDESGCPAGLRFSIFPRPEHSPTRVELGVDRTFFNWRSLRVIVAFCLVFEPYLKPPVL
jgi:hypothetical protein